MQLGETVEVVEFSDEVHREIREPTAVLTPEATPTVLNIHSFNILPVDCAPAMVHVNEALRIFAPGISPLPDFPEFSFAVERHHRPAFPSLWVNAHEDTCVRMTRVFRETFQNHHLANLP